MLTIIREQMPQNLYFIVIDSQWFRIPRYILALFSIFLRLSFYSSFIYSYFPFWLVNFESNWASEF